jgi:C4-dicarboxylate transporter DctM subunit
MIRKALKILDNAIDKLISASVYIGVALLLILSGLTTYQALGRFFGLTARGIFDAALYTLTIFPFVTVAFVQKKEAHVRVEVLTSKLPERVGLLLEIATYLIALIYVLIFCWQSASWARMLLNSGMLTSAVWEIPKWIIVAIMISGMLLLSLQIIRTVAHSISSFYRSTTPAELRWRPWTYLCIFVLCLVGGTVLYNHVNPVLGLVALVLVLLLAGLPVFYMMGMVGLYGLYSLLGESSIIQLPITAYDHLFSFPLACLPLYILGGVIMERSRIVQHIFTFFEIFVGFLPSSLLIVTLLAGGLFCAISGSSMGTCAVMVAVAVPYLVSRGYRKDVACGLVGASSVGALIPPSIGYIIYGVITGVSIARLYIAALLPGALLFGIYFLYIMLRSTFNKYWFLENNETSALSKAPQLSMQDILSVFLKAIWGLLLPVLVLGGIYTGIWTPTEAAGFLVVYAIIVSVFILRSLKWSDFWKSGVDSTRASSMIICMLFAAFGFAMVIAQLQIAPGLVEFARELGLDQLGVLAFIGVILIIFGMFLPPSSIIVISLPLFFPLAASVNVDPLWFGIFFGIMLEIGNLTPPVCMNVFVICGATGFPFQTVLRGVLPYIFLMMLTIILMYFFPQIATWLPSMMN